VVPLHPPRGGAPAAWSGRGPITHDVWPEREHRSSFRFAV